MKPRDIQCGFGAPVRSLPSRRVRRWSPARLTIFAVAFITVVALLGVAAMLTAARSFG